VKLVHVEREGRKRERKRRNQSDMQVLGAVLTQVNHAVSYQAYSRAGTPGAIYPRRPTPPSQGLCPRSHSSKWAVWPVVDEEDNRLSHAMIGGNGVV
jgi:hypothetical protein